jgi:hypothetical protein
MAGLTTHVITGVFMKVGACRRGKYGVTWRFMSMKSQKSSSLVTDLEETFNNLRLFSIKLNPEKCIFGVSRGKLMGYIITERDIKVNPDKILVIGQVRNVKYV